MKREKAIELIELQVKPQEILSVKRFYEQFFEWTFKKWSENYYDTQDSGVAFSITTDENTKRTRTLLVTYTQNLEGTQKKVLTSGATITKDIFSFPGGRRFEFLDPAGNELAFWSDK